jgi:hypothetical protein
MKKSITVIGVVLFLCTMFCLSSCIFDGADNDKRPAETCEIKVIDRCEYIYVSRRPFGPEFSITHKGNCRYCAERAKELKN